MFSNQLQCFLYLILLLSPLAQSTYSPYVLIDLHYAEMVTLKESKLHRGKNTEAVPSSNLYEPVGLVQASHEYLHRHIENTQITSSFVMSLFCDNIFARVVYISTDANSPEEVIFPNALQGTTRRNVLLKRGSSPKKGDTFSIHKEGQL